MKFKSQVFTQASGSIGGQTFSHNKGGMYTRARRTPTNPNTSRQAVVRAALGGASQAWNELTDSQRAAWKLYGENVPVLNRLGDPITLSGQQMFNRTNSLVEIVNATTATWVAPVPSALPAIPDAPTTYNTGESVSAYTSFLAPGTGDWSLEGSYSAPASGDATLLVFLGRPQNAGRRFYKGPYQLAYYANVNPTATGFTISVGSGDFADFVAHLDYPPAAGLWQPVRTRLLFDDGRVSQDFQDFVLWGASEA